MVEIFELHFLVKYILIPSWPLIVFNVVFDISATWATQNRRQN